MRDLQPRRRKAHWKLVTGCFLAIVLVLGALEQFRRRPAAISKAPSSPPTERAVFGEKPAVATEATKAAEPPSPSEAEENERSRSGTAGVPLERNGAVPAYVRRVVETWRTSTKNGDLETCVNLYARRVERFFTKTNVTRDAVRRE